MSSSIKISVIIPVFNGENYVSEAIQSVINQTYKVHEIIVIDDGSTDGSAQIIKSFPQTSYYFKQNGGLSSALNCGIQKVSGDYIAFLDADDYWSLDKLEKQLNAFENDNHLDVVFSYHKQFYAKPLNELSTEEISDTQRVLPAYSKGALLVKVKSFLRVGMFDETIIMGDFLDWYRRASDMQLNMKIIPDVLLYRRIHKDNMSMKNRERITDYLKIMKASLDRRRGLK